MSLNQYFVVFFKKGPNWTEDSSPELDERQKQHLIHLQDLYGAGKLAITGPVDDHSDVDLRAMAVFYRHAFATVDELKELVEEDELFETGHLVAEYASWFFPEGQMLNSRHSVQWTSVV